MALLQRKTQPPSGETIAGKIVAAQDEHTRLLRRQAELAHASVSDAVAEREYEDVCKQLAAKDAEVRRLQLALTEQERQDAITLRERQRGEQAALRKRVGGILEQRTDAARELEKAIGDAVTAFRRLCDLSQRAHAAFSFPTHQLAGLMFGANDIQRLTTFALYKASDAPPQTGGPAFASAQPVSFPGGRAPNFETIAQPEKIEPLVAAIEAANTLARRAMEEGQSNV